MEEVVSQAIRFGPFELNTASLELRRLDRRVKIRPQACKVLALLVERSGHVVTRDELRRHIWATDTFVDFDHSLNFCIRQIRRALGENAKKQRYLETMPRRGYRFTAAHAAEFHSLAVLPFENVAGDAELDYLTEGITESLIRQLAQVPKLQVIARTTGFRFKGRDIRPEAVGRRLGVGAVLTGRVLQRDGRLSIAAELIDVSSGLHLWGEEYERASSDVVRLQQEISGEISAKLRMRVSGRVRSRVSNWGTSDVQAYHLYLRGRHFANMSFGGGFRRGIESFGQAIELDPTYSLAHAGMADCYGYLGFYGYIAPAEAWPKAKAAAMKALEIDERLAEGHASLGLVNLCYDWDPEGGYARCLRAIELNPSYPSAYTHAGGCLIAMGRSEEAIRMIEKAQMLDPLSVWVHTVAGLYAYLGRNYAQAIEVLQKALELDAQSGEARRALGITYIQLNEIPRAIEELEAACRLLGDTHVALASLGRAYGRAGKIEQAERLLEQIKAASERKAVAGASAAAICVALGRHDEAMDYLETAVRNRSSWLVWLEAEPWWDDLRHHARFQGLRERIRPTN
jgi:TolB-like protein/Flp pilus assembly protein TadD